MRAEDAYALTKAVLGEPPEWWLARYRDGAVTRMPFRDLSTTLEVVSTSVPLTRTQEAQLRRTHPHPRDIDPSVTLGLAPGQSLAWILEPRPRLKVPSWDPLLSEAQRTAGPIRLSGWSLNRWLLRFFEELESTA